MKALLTVALFFSVTAMGLAADASQIKGAWEKIAYDYGSGHKSPEGNRQVKFITDHRFAWVVFDKEGKTLAAGGGTYTLNRTSLVERVEYIDKEDAAMVGKDQSFTVTVEGDTYTMTGKLSNGMKIMEKWKRLD